MGSGLLCALSTAEPACGGQGVCPGRADPQGVSAGGVGMSPGLRENKTGVPTLGGLAPPAQGESWSPRRPVAAVLSWAGRGSYPGQEASRTASHRGRRGDGHTCGGSLSGRGQTGPESLRDRVPPRHPPWPWAVTVNTGCAASVRGPLLPPGFLDFRPWLRLGHQRGGPRATGSDF